MTIAPARRAAYEVVLRVFEDEAYADRVLRTAADSLDDRDRALAQRLAYGTVQRVRTLDHAIETLGRRPVRDRAIGPGHGALAAHAAEVVSLDVGDRDMLRASSRETLRGFYSRHYVPDNMTLVVVGAIRPDEVRAAVARTFAAPPARGYRRATPPMPRGSSTSCRPTKG